MRSLATSLRRLRATVRALEITDYEVGSLANGLLTVAPGWAPPGVFDRIAHAQLVADVLNALCRPTPRLRAASKVAPGRAKPTKPRR